MNRWTPIAAQVAKRLRPMRAMDDAATDIVETHPAESGSTKPVLFLEDEDRSRVTATYGERSVAEEWRQVDGTDVRHASTRIHTFKDVLATPFGFFTGMDAFARYGPIRYRDLARARIERRETGFYSTPPVALRYFGHWAIDALAASYLRRPDESLFLPFDPSWDHARQYVERMGIDRIDADYVHFDRLSYSRDIGMNADRAARISRLRADVRRVAGDAGVPGVFIRRGTSGVARVLKNEDTLARALSERGFAIVNTSDELGEIWRKAAGAPITVSMEGSHWTHLYLCAREDAFHILLNPTDRFNNVFAIYVDRTPGQIAGTLAHRDGEGYTVDIDRVLRLVDRSHERLHRRTKPAAV